MYTVLSPPKRRPQWSEKVRAMVQTRHLVCINMQNILSSENVLQQALRLSVVSAILEQSTGPTDICWRSLMVTTARSTADRPLTGLRRSKTYHIRKSIYRLLPEYNRNRISLDRAFTICKTVPFGRCSAVHIASRSWWRCVISYIGFETHINGCWSWRAISSLQVRSTIKPSLMKPMLELYIAQLRKPCNI